MTTKLISGTRVAVLAAACLGSAHSSAFAQTPAASPAAAATACKTFGKGKCCEAPVVAHLALPTVLRACGQSEATFLGEAGSKDTCKYFFQVKDAAAETTFVQVYAPAQKEVPSAPTDPFFSWQKVGKVFMTDKAKSPKAAPMLANATGLWLPGAGYFVSVNASTKVCTKEQARKLAGALR